MGRRWTPSVDEPVWAATVRYVEGSLAANTVDAYRSDLELRALARCRG